MILTSFLLAGTALLVTLIGCAILYARWHYGELEKLGIPVVKPHFFLGSLPNYHSVINHFQDYEWFKQHGDVYGVYHGRTPQVHICDPEMIRQIFIKDFDKFANRDFHFEFGPGLEEMMDFLKGLSPFFTSAKLNRMSLAMRDVCEDYIGETKGELQRAGGCFENFILYQEMMSLLTHIVARCTLSITIKNAKDPDNVFSKALRDIFVREEYFFVKHLALAFPFLVKIFGDTIDKASAAFFVNIFQDVLNQRRANGDRQEDLADTIGDIVKETVTREDFRRLGITETTFVAQGAIFFFGGQDPMATTITLLAFYLKRNPSVEEKLMTEIDEYMGRNGQRANRETLSELVYLNACIQEILRLHPNFTRPGRICSENWEFKGLKIKKGMAVVLPLWPYHRNPKYFPNPEQFDPERFMPHNRDKKHPLAFASFGHGPRICIGMRFALEATTMACLYIFHHFKVTPKPDMEIQYIPGIPLAAVILGDLMSFQLRERNHS